MYKLDNKEKLFCNKYYKKQHYTVQQSRINFLFVLHYKIFVPNFFHIKDKYLKPSGDKVLIYHDKSAP